MAHWGTECALLFTAVAGLMSWGCRVRSRVAPHLRHRTAASLRQALCRDLGTELSSRPEVRPPCRTAKRWRVTMPTPGPGMAAFRLLVCRTFEHYGRHWRMARVTAVSGESARSTQSERKARSRSSAPQIAGRSTYSAANSSVSPSWRMISSARSASA